MFGSSIISITTTCGLSLACCTITRTSCLTGSLCATGGLCSGGLGSSAGAGAGAHHAANTIPASEGRHEFFHALIVVSPSEKGAWERAQAVERTEATTNAVGRTIR